MLKKIQCQICNKYYNKLSSHVQISHNMPYKEYYDKYLKKEGEGICPICGKKTNFYRNKYTQTCSYACATQLRNNNKQHELNVQKFEKENDCTSINTLRNKYGQGWYKANIFTESDYIKTKIDTVIYFLKNDKIKYIEEYINNQKHTGTSNLELYICNFLDKYNISYIRNTKQIIKPLELDIYIPDKNLAIEFNGTWFHCIENNREINHILNKSLLCREQGIRLIHIYEFEDLKKQLELLKNLVLDNKDKYPKKDFNKNNLIDFIPKPELIHISKRGYHIYGAGKLYI